MSSFIAETIVFISNERATISAVLSSSRSLFNSSTVPVILNIDLLWDQLREKSNKHSAHIEEKMLSILTMSQTFQFCPKLRFHHAHYDEEIFDGIFPPLFDTTYFCRTLKSLTIPWYVTLGRVLEKVVSLEKLELIGGHLPDTAKCLESLPTGSCLRELIIYDATDISDDTLTTVLTKKTPGLRRLELSYFSPADQETFAASLGSLESLEKLALSYSRLTTQTMMSLFPNKLRRIRNISLTCCLNLTDADFTMLAKLPDLEIIELSPHDVSEESLRALTDNQSSNLVDTLTSISLVNNPAQSQIKSSIPCLLSSLSRLKNIHLTRADLSTAAMKTFATLHQLESLRLQSCSFNVGESDALEFLVTTAAASPGENDKESTPSLPNLKVLKLDFVGNYSAKSIKALPKLPALESLTLMGFELQDEIVDHLPKFPRLSKLVLTDAGRLTASALVQSLPLCKHLSSLYIARFEKIRPRDLRLIQEALSGVMTTMISEEDEKIATPSLFDEAI